MCKFNFDANIYLDPNTRVNACANNLNFFDKLLDMVKERREKENGFKLLRVVKSLLKQINCRFCLPLPLPLLPRLFSPLSFRCVNKFEWPFSIFLLVISQNYGSPDLNIVPPVWYIILELYLFQNWISKWYF